jgi:hypothetical protein
VAEIWSELNIRGQALREDIRDAGLYNSHFRKIRKFEKLLGLIMKYWEPNPKREKDTRKREVTGSGKRDSD